MPEPIRLSEEQLEELRTKGLPLIVEIDGREVVVQDGEAYRAMVRFLDELDIAESARICRESWGAMRSGDDPGVPAREFVDQLRRRTRRAG